MGADAELCGTVAHMEDSTDTTPALRPRLRPSTPGVLGGPTRDSDHIEELVHIYKLHHPDGNPARIEAAWRCAAAAHDGVYRRSGDPYITHPIEVAEITADLGMDEASVCAALLHDVIEDTAVEANHIRDMYAHGTAEYSGDVKFADDVTRMVEGLTKLDGLRFDTGTGRRAADLRRLLAAIADDPRVLVVKLSDRLHNMRTLSALSEAKQQRIAKETLDVYAPLAHRLGMAALRGELEDLCFAILYPDEHAAVRRGVARRKEGAEEELDRMCHELSGRLDGAGIAASVQSRIKHLWGIYTKMLRTGRPLDDINDITGIRVICTTVTDCYAAVGLIHGMWTPIAGTFKDYIANPRLNMYQSLHTTVAGPSGRPVELQIRTHDMHEVAEYGVAAHWTYKEGENVSISDIAEIAWMRRLLDADDQAAAASYLADVADDLKRQEIYCLTPQGRVVALPDGATPIDFAYQVHTEVGDRAIGARVNGTLVGLDRRLNDGETVEIITSTDENRGPNASWASWVATPKARRRIRLWHTRARRSTSAETGRAKIQEALERRAERAGIAAPGDAALDVELDRVKTRWGYHDTDALAAAVGDARISPDAVAARILPAPPRPAPRAHTSVESNARVVIQGADGIDAHFATCCDPEPPAKIIGWVTRGRGVSIHRLDCTNAAHLMKRDDARIVSVSWVGDSHEQVNATITIHSFDHPGILAAATAVIARCGANIRGMTAEAANGRAEHLYDITVGGSTTLEEITAGMWELDGIIDVLVTPEQQPSTAAQVEKRRKLPVPRRRRENKTNASNSTKGERGTRGAVTLGSAKLPGTLRKSSRRARRD